MAENKTRKTDASVTAFLDKVEKEQKREDAYRLLELMRDVSGFEPAMWGPSIVGFGSYHYRYESGREGDMPVVGFSPRKQAFTLYIMDGFDAYEEMLGDLGKHSTGKSCLYIKRLSDVDETVLRRLIEASVAHVKSTNETT